MYMHSSGYCEPGITLVVCAFLMVTSVPALKILHKRHANVLTAEQETFFRALLVLVFLSWRSTVSSDFFSTLNNFATPRRCFYNYHFCADIFQDVYGFAYV